MKENTALRHKGLPVQGYKTHQTTDNIVKVNRNKMEEEKILRILDNLKEDPTVDQRWLAIGRTQIEKGFMSVNRAVFQPERLRLPEDDANG